MTQSSPNIYQRVHSVMKDVTTIQKEDKKVNGQYTFVSHDEVTKVMHEHFVKHGIVMAPSVIEIKQDGNRTEIMMSIELVNIDKPDDRIKVLYPGYGIDSQDKGIGKAISYAVKYALLKTFCLETSDDVEKDNINHKPDRTEDIHEILQVKQLENILNSLTPAVKASYIKRMETGWNVKSIRELTQKQAIEMADTIRAETNVSYGSVKIPAS